MQGMQDQIHSSEEHNDFWFLNEKQIVTVWVTGMANNIWRGYIYLILFEIFKSLYEFEQTPPGSNSLIFTHPTWINHISLKITLIKSKQMSRTTSSKQDVPSTQANKCIDDSLLEHFGWKIWQRSNCWHFLPY